MVTPSCLGYYTGCVLLYANDRMSDVWNWTFFSCSTCNQTARKPVQLPLVHEIHLQFMAFIQLVLLLIHLISLSSCAAYLEQAPSSAGAQHVACKHDIILSSLVQCAAKAIYSRFPLPGRDTGRVDRRRPQCATRHGAETRRSNADEADRDATLQ